MAYRFTNASSDYIEFALGPFSGHAFSVVTAAVFLKRNSTGAHAVYAFSPTTFPPVVGSRLTSSGCSTHWGAAGAQSSPGSMNTALGSTSQWLIVAFTKTSGSTLGRYHVHDGTSWAHADTLDAALGNVSTSLTSETFRVGRYENSGGISYLDADVVCVGIKKAASSDATVETLSRTDFSAWTGFGFDWLIGFESSGTLSNRSGGGGNETGRSGTSVVSDPAGWSWATTTAVSSTRTLQYGIVAQVSSTRELKYGIGGVASTRQLVYGVLQSVAASMHLNYAVTGAISSSRQLKYTVVGVGRAAATRQLMYGIDGAFETQGRFCIAFNAAALEWDEAIFTRLDDTEAYPGLRIAGYQIDRGRQYELDRTDTGRATVTINDRDGILNPRNPDGPFYGQLNPLLQACINRYNPVTGAWRTRFRGYIEDLAYEFDPSQRVNRLTITLVDMFEILAAIEMQDGQFGHDITLGDGQITFARARVNDRIIHLLNDCGIQPHARVIFSGNVILQPQPYSAGESPMTVIQEAADGEFPGVSNVFCDRKGRLCFHGRFAKFFPDEVAAGASIGAWDFQRWNAADGAEVASTPTFMAPVRAFGFTRGLAKVINQATATPNGIDDANVAFQLVEDTASIARYGIRSWSAMNLVTDESLIDGSDELVETKRFATYYVQNYRQPRDRIEGVTFRPLRADDYRAEYLWKLLCEVDISDAMTVTVASPGGGGFAADEYFVEGVHETVQPMGPDDGLEDVTLTLDLSPAAYFAANPWPDDDEEES